MSAATSYMLLVKPRGGASAPVNTVLPSLTAADFNVGTTVTVSLGAWTGATSLAAELRHVATQTVIDTFTADGTYDLVDTDFGQELKLYVVAQPGDVAAESAAVGPVVATGIYLWLDASDASTLFQDSAGTSPAAANNDVIGRWADKSGNGRHATQTTTANKPLLKTNVQNGLPVIEFDGTDDYFTLADAPNLAQPTFFIVASQNTGATGFRGLIELKQGTLFARINVSANFGLFDSTAFRDSGSALNNTATQIMVMANAVNDIDFSKNGGAITTITTGTAFDNRATGGIGRNAGGQYHIGKMEEIIAFAAAPSDTLRDAIIAYQKTKWGIA